MDATVAGLLLCRAADWWLAFRAKEVVAVEAWAEGSERAPHARLAFGFSPDRGRALVSASGDAVGVDEVQVFADSVTVLPPPGLLRTALGGSLSGFVHAKDRLWPLLHLVEFSRFLALPETPR